MNEELKIKLEHQSALQDILGVNRVQAWRIWTGKSKLTTSNEKLIRMTLEAKQNVGKQQ